jgi:hypothetical protein
MRSQAGIAAIGLLAAGASVALAETPVTVLDEVVMYAIDSGTHELVRYEFETDTFSRIGVVSDRFGNVVTDIEGLAFVRHGPFKGLYAAANYYESQPSRLVKISPLDAMATPLPLTIGFGRIEGLVSVPMSGSAVTDFTRVDDSVSLNVPTALRFDALDAQYGRDAVTMKFSIGGAEFEPFGLFDKPQQANIKGQTPLTWVAPDVYPVGTEIGVRGAGWSDNSPWQLIRDTDSLDPADADKVMVFRNGDVVPDIDGWGNQDDLIDILRPLMDYSVQPPEIRLLNNQAVYCFELGSNNDYQDLVVLVTFADHPSYFNTVGGDLLMAVARYPVEVDDEGDYQFDAGTYGSGHCIININPENGRGTLLQLDARQYEGLALHSDLTIFGTQGGDLYTIALDRFDVRGQVETKLRTLTGVTACRALEFAFGEYEPRIMTAPAAPDDWSANGILFGFDDTSNTLLIIDPVTGNSRAYPCAIDSMDFEGMVFVTKNTDAFGMITAAPHD